MGVNEPEFQMKLPSICTYISYSWNDTPPHDTIRIATIVPRFTCNISNTIHFEEETNKTIKKEIIQSDFEILNSVKKICKQIFHYALF